MKNNNELSPIEYLYRPTLRPVGFATMPKNVAWDYIEAPANDPIIAHRRGITLSRQPYGIIATDRMLTRQEREQFGLEVC